MHAFPQPFWLRWLKFQSSAHFSASTSLSTARGTSLGHWHVFTSARCIDPEVAVAWGLHDDPVVVMSGAVVVSFGDAQGFDSATAVTLDFHVDSAVVVVCVTTAIVLVVAWVVSL